MCFTYKNSQRTKLFSYLYDKYAVHVNGDHLCAVDFRYPFLSLLSKKMTSTAGISGIFSHKFFLGPMSNM